MKPLLAFLGTVSASAATATRSSGYQQQQQFETQLSSKYVTTSTFTSKTTFRVPPLYPFAIPGPFTVVEHDITILEPHPSRPTSYPETIVQTAITKATNTVYASTGSSFEPTITTTTTTRFDTYHMHTPAPSHLRPGYSFTDFPGCGDCVLDMDWEPDAECDAAEWGTGCSNQQCQWRGNEGSAGLWYCFAGPHRGDREYMGRVCWHGDDIGFETLAKPCLYGDQLPHCVPCVGMHVACDKDNGACPTRPGHPDFRTERPGVITSRLGWM